MSQISNRKLSFIMVLLIGFFLGAAYYIQNINGIMPCPLCLLQRFCMMVLGGLCLFASLINFKTIGQRIFSLLTGLVSLAGLSLAARQTWLQFHPNLSSDCGASLQYMMEVFPWKEVFKKVLIGTSECSQVEWQFLHLSLAEWSLGAFILLLLLSVLQFKKTLMQNNFYQR